MARTVFDIFQRRVWIVLFSLFVLHTLTFDTVASQPFGPPYPVTGSWLKERFSQSDWNSTLHRFSQQGGDTVILRAPPVELTTRDELAQDPDFKWCYDVDVFGKKTFCVDDAVRELTALSVNVKYLAVYRHEDNLQASDILKCPYYDKRMVSGRIYHRIVLPLYNNNMRDKCELNNTDVLVLFTSFAGIDPQELLLTTAQEYNMSAYFGIPPLSEIIYEKKLSSNLTYAYLEFIHRLLESQTRASASMLVQKQHVEHFEKTNPFRGYFWSADFLLSQINSTNADFLNFLGSISDTVHAFNMSFGVSTAANVNKLYSTLDLQGNVEAFETLASKGDIDIISVKDGRGSGTSGLYWPTQMSQPINDSDTTLFTIIQKQFPMLALNSTYEDVFNASTHQIFSALADTTERLKRDGTDVVLWLNIEAYDLLSDDPCLPVDHGGSGQDRMLNRISKSRVDRVLTHAGAMVTKVVAFAWDPGFTCKTKSYPSPLSNQILADMGRPIISSCDFHSRYNRSVVVIGYNMLGETQGYTVEWPNVSGKRVQSNVYGYYFEIDWGVQHGRVPSLMYIQMYDPYNVQDLAPKGYVRIKANSSHYACVYKYDFTTSDNEQDGVKYESRKSLKKYVREMEKPIHRIEAQDVPFTT